VTPQRVLCPTSASWHGRHYVTDRCWRIVAPDDVETIVCSAACAVTWLVYALPGERAAASSEAA
jgi:hypothetical protein